MAKKAKKKTDEVTETKYVSFTFDSNEVLDLVTNDKVASRNLEQATVFLDRVRARVAKIKAKKPGAKKAGAKKA